MSSFTIKETDVGQKNLVVYLRNESFSFENRQCSVLPMTLPIPLSLRILSPSLFSIPFFPLSSTSSKEKTVIISDCVLNSEASTSG